MNKKITKSALLRIINEAGYSIKKDDIDEIMPELEPQLDADDSVRITNENENDDDIPEVPDEERMEREFEYGVKNETFDKLMETLNKQKVPTIKLTESINPRIKVKDLIKHLKNKK